MRLIDADALLRPIPSYNPVKYTHEYGDVVTVQDVKSIPTIDAVAVVRCKECNWYFSEQELCGLSEDFFPHPYDFCSRGKRRTDANS